MAERLALTKPITPMILTQSFGENLTCIPVDGQGCLTIARGATCPAGYVGLYTLHNMKGHNGLDMQAYHGQPVYAATEGIVQDIQDEPERGLGIEIVSEHKYQFDNESEPHYAMTRYWHLKIDSFKVAKGDRVTVGQVIALADNTGDSSGDHLHFELKMASRNERNKKARGKTINIRNGYLGAIDPAPYLTS
jgi:murein DD-endopeptidase MepM/ murein hydrolase activator NlpD